MALKPNMSVVEAVEYLKMLADTVDNDIEPLLDTQGGAPFAIAREVMCYIDHLGALMNGRNTNRGMTNHAKGFIKKYMRGDDTDYQRYGPALYEMYRHGTVHNFEPCTLTDNKQELVWETSTGGRKGYAKDSATGAVVEVVHLSPKKKCGNIWSLPVSTRCLIEDLKRAIETFKEDIRENNNLMREWNKHAEFVTRPKVISGEDWPLQNKTGVKK